MPPRMKKKGKTGAAKNYITRNQALKKLQLSLADFRKLCIWKSIFPREPRNRKKANKSATYSTTFYYAKDIQYLLHEPLINKFRDLKALEKKISKALGRGDVGDAKRLDANAGRPDVTGKARFTLDHVIRERYPTFNDALRDLDDCLSMLFLFANLPSTDSVPAKVIARCERLCLEFEHYCIMSHSLRKSFLSIKGIYYQATINGEDILWLVPYKFNQRVTQDVDYRIMGTFVEFYITLLTFVNFRLYTKQGLRYPPKFDQNKDNQSAELGAFTLEGRGVVEEHKQIAESASSDAQVDTATQAAVNAIVKNLKSAATTEYTAVAPTTITEDSTAIDKFEPAVAGGDVLPQPSYGSKDPSKLFANMIFFFSRETPRQPIEFILRAFGCKHIGWDAVLGEGAFTVNENDPIITHQIVDRPPIQVAAEEDSEMENAEDNQTSQKLTANRQVPGRVYVQPQWVWDCINDEELKPVDLYAPGAQLPPHLSPFVKPEAGRYDPTIPLADQQTEAEVLESEGDEVDEDDMDEDDEGFYGILNNEAAAPKGGEESSDEEQEEDGAAVASDDEDAQRQAEIKSEMRGVTVKAKEGKAQSAKEKAKAAARKELQRKAKEEAEEKERAMGMMSKKKRRLYEQMVYTNSKKSTEDETLRAKRRKMEKEKMKKSRM